MGVGIICLVLASVFISAEAVASSPFDDTTLHARILSQDVLERADLKACLFVSKKWHAVASQDAVWQSKARDVAYLPNLPVDVWLIILSKLRNKDFCHLSMTCKGWRVLFSCDRIWERRAVYAYNCLDQSLRGSRPLFEWLREYSDQAAVVYKELENYDNEPGSSIKLPTYPLKKNLVRDGRINVHKALRKLDIELNPDHEQWW